MNEDQPGTTDIDVLILKLDAGGETVWQKTYGGSSLDYAISMEKTSDGNNIIFGETSSYGPSMGSNLFLLKIDPDDGSVLWQKVYGGSSIDYARTVKETRNGGLLVAGSSKSFSSGDYDGWILNLDSTGNIIWQKVYGSPDWDFFRYAQETSDGSFFITGNSYTNYDIYTLKINSNGEIPRCQSFTDTDITPVISDMVPVDAVITVNELQYTSGDTPVTAQDADLLATNICYAASSNLSIMLLLL